MFCNHCGAEVEDDAVICPKCGCAVNKNHAVPVEEDKNSTGFLILGLLFPLIGFILWLVYKEKNLPLKAQSAGKGALIGLIISVAIGIFSAIAGSCFISSMLNDLY